MYLWQRAGRSGQCAGGGLRYTVDSEQGTVCCGQWTSVGVGAHCAVGSRRVLCAVCRVLWLWAVFGELLCWVLGAVVQRTMGWCSVSVLCTGCCGPCDVGSVPQTGVCAQLLQCDLDNRQRTVVPAMA